MQKFDRSAANALTKEVLADLEALCKRHGLTVANKGGRFTASNFTLKLEFATKNEDGVAQTKEVSDWAVWCYQYGFKPEHLNQEFKHGSDTYVIHGVKTRSTKFPIIARRKDNGKLYKFHPATIHNAMKAAA